MPKDKKVEKAIKWYKENRGVYKDLAVKAELIIKDALSNKDIFYHSLESRAKEIDSFKEKAEKDKYDDPINEITDLTGIRIIAYFEKDVYKICDIVKELFKIDYSNSEDKSDLLEADKMGYKSVHYIATLTNERTNLSEFEKFKGLYFEIQVKSILQHAWAEIEHDKNYKFKENLPQHLQRRFYSLAGMLEMADREFNSLAKEVDDYKEKVKKLTKNGKRDLKINNDSLKNYLLEEFDDEIKNNILQFSFGKDSDLSNIIEELKKFGINNLVELDSILSEKIHDNIKTELKELSDANFLGVIRLIMIINDYKKYFEKVWEDGTYYFHEASVNILKKYNVPIEKLSKEYDFGIE
ncbi:GTP pyrophosphokinase [Sporohalobacter salinus]|uniref:GTP pyrophosphokinase n=1 Tax=Sporohalobacter salinus TaxID=1494606 RepID=UPI00195F2518|nr:hypothetical protein [Sporohalobacter salinus]MBM7623675.1 ppGpp synthetase/RelA/SpoT-type nucleotidyltransferase [Sporohalobacter salinus]